MPKRISSKMAGSVKPHQLSPVNSDYTPIDESTIEEIAKIFMQTQANLQNSNNSPANPSQEMLALLHQINNKLERWQASPTSTSIPAPNQNQQSEQNQLIQQQPQQNEQPSDYSSANSTVSQELKNLFSALLTTGNSAASSDNSQQTNKLNQQKPASQQHPANTQEEDSQTASIAVQTAAQVLSQAQFELSNELEASLQSLKQVIAESEKIANKISNLLGEENNQ